jgi:hypothetical protein
MDKWIGEVRDIFVIEHTFGASLANSGIAEIVPKYE